MSDTPLQAVAALAAHRTSIDRLDAILIQTLAERFSHTTLIGQLKYEHNLPPSDPLREQQQFNRIEKLAHESGLDPDFAKKILRTVIDDVLKTYPDTLSG